MVTDTSQDLAAMPAGAALSAALHHRPVDTVPDDRILEQLRAQRRLLSHEEARLALAMYEQARRTGASAPGTVDRRQVADRWAPHETRAALHLTLMTAEAEHALAEFVIGHCPAVFAAWDAGDIDRTRVRVFEQYLFGLTAEQIEAVCEVAVPPASGLTTGELAALLRRMVIAVDPDAARRWYRRSLAERRVCGYLTAEGTVTITATGLPPDEAEAACERVERLAAAARHGGAPATTDQLRADVFVGLLDGRFHHLDDDGIVADLIAASVAAAAAAHAAATAAATADSGAAGSATTDVPSGSGAGAPADAASPEAGADDEPGDGGPDGHGPGDGGPDGQGQGHGGPDRHGPGHGGPDGQGQGHGGPDGHGPGHGGPDGHGPGHPGPDDGPAPTTPMAHRWSRGRGDGRRPGDQRRGIEIRVALSTLLGHDDRPGEIPGLGPVLADLARARAMLQTRAEWRFAVIGADGSLLSEGVTRRRPDGATRTGSPPGGVVEIQVPITLLAELAADPAGAGAWAAVVADIVEQHDHHAGHLVDLDARPADRLPGAALRRHTEIRDRSCTFPGCRRPARECAQDHRREYAVGGLTIRANLGPVCDHDHALRHLAGWIATGDEPGLTTWRSPLGGVYEVRGRFLCADGTEHLDPIPDQRQGQDLPPDPEPATGPDPDSGPILRRPPPAGHGGQRGAEDQRPRGDPFTSPGTGSDDPPAPF